MRWTLYASLATVLVSLVPGLVLITTPPLALPKRCSIQIWDSTVVVVQKGHPSHAVPLAFILWLLSLLLAAFVGARISRRDRRRGFPLDGISVKDP